MISFLVRPAHVRLWFDGYDTVWSCAGGNRDLLVHDFVFIVFDDSLNEHSDRWALFPSIGRCKVTVGALVDCPLLEDADAAPEADV